MSVYQKLLILGWILSAYGDSLTDEPVNPLVITLYADLFYVYNSREAILTAIETAMQFFDNLPQYNR